MSQLSFMPIDPNPPTETRPPARLLRLPRARARLAPRTAVGAPGYVSVRAAAERLELQPRSVRYLIERDRLSSQRLGRMHFLPTAQVEAYRRARRLRRRVSGS